MLTPAIELYLNDRYQAYTDISGARSPASFYGKPIPLDEAIKMIARRIRENPNISATT